jgi:hypothetical protein
VPNGVITFRRFSLSNDKRPNWSTLRELLSDMHLTTGEKIEDVKNVLQVDTVISFKVQLNFSVC